MKTLEEVLEEYDEILANMDEFRNDPEADFVMRRSDYLVLRAASPVSTGADAKDAARYVQETERLRAALAEVVWAFDKRWHAESERKRTAAISPRMEEAFNDARLLLAGNSPEAALAAMSDEAGKV